SGELTFEATAEALDIPVGTAKSRMRSALAKLRRDLSAFAPTTARRNA
ncbi:MAG: RNA polymerase sigma factor SigE, partial [bacterium]|nr:RNA polymerase sigma factor SigE [bacterium]